MLEPRTAKTVATFTNTPEKSPAITLNSYGKGRAIYIAVPCTDVGDRSAGAQYVCGSRELKEDRKLPPASMRAWLKEERST